MANQSNMGHYLKSTLKWLQASQKYVELTVIWNQKNSSYNIGVEIEVRKQSSAIHLWQIRFLGEIYVKTYNILHEVKIYCFTNLLAVLLRKVSINNMYIVCSTPSSQLRLYVLHCTYYYISTYVQCSLLGRYLPCFERDYSCIHY